jgi:hypothetical protein
MAFLGITRIVTATPVAPLIVLLRTRECVEVGREDRHRLHVGALRLARDRPDLRDRHGPVERADMHPRVALPTVKQVRVVHDLAAEHLDHLVAVAAPPGLKVLPLLGALIHAHVLDREGANIEGLPALLRLLLALDVLALWALNEVELWFQRRLRLAMELDESLARPRACR